MAERLVHLAPIELIPVGNREEVAYSPLLDNLELLFDKIILSQGGSRQDCEALLRNFAARIHLFNPVEVQDYFIDKLDALITFSCDAIKRACFGFIAQLITH